MTFVLVAVTGVRGQEAAVSILSGVFAHASSSKGVTKSNIHEKYYVKGFVKANRIFEM